MAPITVLRKQYTISDFISWQKSGTLELSPSFQRRPRWSTTAKSFFIDTIVRGLPVPIIIIRELVDLKSLRPKREVVDGQQRLRTIFSFIDSTCLPDYDPNRDKFVVKRIHNSEIANKEFGQLSESTRQNILNYEFSTHVLTSDVDDRLVLEMFARMNSTGVKVNAQEVRNALYFGAFKVSMYQLATEQLTRWRTWNIISETDIARMAEVEFTSDLALFILTGNFGVSQTILDKAYAIHEEEFPEQTEVERRFRIIMDALDDSIGTDLSKTAFATRLLFHPLFVRYYALMFGIKSPLTRKAPAKLPSDIREKVLAWNQRIVEGKVPEKAAVALQKRDNNERARRERYDYFEKAI